MHFHPLLGRIPLGAMGKGIEVKVAAQFTIDASQEVLVEGGCDTACVVIGRDQDGGILHQIDSDQIGRTLPQQAPLMNEKRPGVVRREIAQGRTWEEPDHRPTRSLAWQRQRVGEIVTERRDRHAWVVRPYRVGSVFKGHSADIYGRVDVDLRRDIQQNAGLDAGAATEFNQRCALRNMCGNLPGGFSQEGSGKVPQKAYRPFSDG